MARRHTAEVQRNWHVTNGERVAVISAETIYTGQRTADYFILPADYSGATVEYEYAPDNGVREVVLWTDSEGQVHEAEVKYWFAPSPVLRNACSL